MSYKALRVRYLVRLFPSLDGRFFVTVVCEDEKVYQVKFNIKNHKSNQNEFIAHYVGKLINAPILDGVFVKFEDEHIQNLIMHIKNQNIEIELPVMSDFKNNVFFAIEWKSNIVTPQSYDSFERNLKQSKNFKEFFCIFPYDQYLRNHDRHIQNHLFIKPQSRKSIYYSSIDSDRIFGSLAWDKIEDEMNLYNCFKDEKGCIDGREFIYSLVDETHYTDVLRYAGAVGLIGKSDIKECLEIIDKVYNLTKLDYAKINMFLMERKEDFYGKCLKNQKCFTRLSQRRIEYV